MAHTLLVGSCEPFSGKSAVVLGLGRQLARMGVAVRFGKPLATDLEEPVAAGEPLLDADVRFVGATLGLPEGQLIPSADLLDAAVAERRLSTGDLDPGAGFAQLQQRLAEAGEGVTLPGAMPAAWMRCWPPAPRSASSWSGWCSTPSPRRMCPPCARPFLRPWSAWGSRCWG
jgi:hypothetical protein